MSFIDHFRGIASRCPSVGSTILLWYNVLSDNYLEEQLPHLYSFAKNKNMSIATYRENKSPLMIFHTPLSAEAFQELHILHQRMDSIQNQSIQKDTWIYYWGSDRYTSSKYYALPFKTITPLAPIVGIWKSKCSKK